MIGNGVATIVISRTEGKLDLARLNAILEGRAAGADEEAVPTDLVDGTPLPSRNQAYSRPPAKAAYHAPVLARALKSARANVDVALQSTERLQLEYGNALWLR
ncbi:hypothetical protein [Bradyrhizobium barranii]|uniref:hypothetical protein n=2 Tax=Nitrobacteraceae TaxID=41294 RepID=UPI0038BC9F78